MNFLFGGLIDLGAAGPASHAVSFAVVGMAALFTAVVRAPRTGMILVTWMTGKRTLAQARKKAALTSRKTPADPVRVKAR